MNQLDLQQHHVLLTGASGGLGQALATELVRRGMRVTLVARPSTALNDLAQQLQQPMLELDLLNADAAQQLRHYAQQSLSTTRPVTGIIHNAGSAYTRLFEHSDWQQQQQLVMLNLLAPMAITHALLPYLKQRPEALIMTVGSVFGAIGYPSQAAYCASKAGLQRFTEALHRECSDSNVRVFHCQPRAIATALNYGAMAQLNQQLGSAVDSPQWVAQQIGQQLQQGKPRRVLGWPERLFVPLNALFPRLVDGALRKPYRLISQLLKEHYS